MTVNYIPRNPTIEPLAPSVYPQYSSPDPLAFSEPARRRLPAALGDRVAHLHPENPAVTSRE